MFDKKYLKSARFDLPIIAVGNLTVGGSGKTPHIEYLIRLLRTQYKVATLSRGYGRKSHGFVLADAQSTALLIGDEPIQFKAKFPEVAVSVCEDRLIGIPRLLDVAPDTQVILLDDAFQHRRVRAGLSILLTEHSNLFTRDLLLPAGWLREAAKNYHRADIIIVSKCPADLSKQEQGIICNELKPFPYQKIYFSYIEYGTPYALFSRKYTPNCFDEKTDVLLVSAIAKSGGLQQYVQSKARKVFVREFRDHYYFDAYDLESIRETFHNLGDTKKIILTTEKDATRLALHHQWFVQNNIEVYIQPIFVRFLNNDGSPFETDILQFMGSSLVE